MEAYIYFVIILLLQIFPLNKIRKTEELNIFDILMLFYALYFVLTPLRCILNEGHYRGIYIQHIVEKCPEAAGSICVVMILFLLANLFLSRFYVPKLSFLYTTRLIRDWDYRIQLPEKSIYLFITISLLTLYPLTNFSQLTDTEQGIERNITIFYGENMPLQIRLILNMIAGAFSTLVVLAVKYRLSNLATTKQKFLSNTCIFLFALCIILRGRTNMINTCAIVLLYLYSTRIERINLKHILGSITVLSFVVFFLFPQYQTFRQIKQDLVKTSIHHDFTDVLIAYADNKHKISVLTDEQQRSFNVYMALTESFTNRYQSSNGGYTWDQILCLNPLHKPQEKYENFVAEGLEGGGDIAETMPTVMNFDLGFIGMFLVPIYYSLYGAVLWLLTKLSHIVFRRNIAFLLGTIMFMEYCMNVEGSISLRFLYNPGIIVLSVFCLLYLLFTLKTPDEEQEWDDDEDYNDVEENQNVLPC